MNNGAINNQTTFEHLNTRLVWCSDGYYRTLLSNVQWGSKNRTCPVFEWCKVRQPSNGPVFKWDLKTGQKVWFSNGKKNKMAAKMIDHRNILCTNHKCFGTNHLKFGQKVRFSNGSCHPKSDLQKVRFTNDYGF